MKKFLLSACLVLTLFASAADAQFFTSETTRPARSWRRATAKAEQQGARLEQAMNLAVAYANLGRMYEKKNDFDKALENYEKGLKIRKDDSYIHRLRGELRMKRGDLRGAIEDLKVVAEYRQESPDYHLSRGLLFVLQGKDAEAEKEFAAHVQMFPASREFVNERIKAAKKLLSEQPQQ
jgi:tetratricopeptide (TPR) repeat protein